MIRLEKKRHGPENQKKIVIRNTYNFFSFEPGIPEGRDHRADLMLIDGMIPSCINAVSNLAQYQVMRPWRNDTGATKGKTIPLSMRP